MDMDSSNGTLVVIGSRNERLVPGLRSINPPHVIFSLPLIRPVPPPLDTAWTTKTSYISVPVRFFSRCRQLTPHPPPPPLYTHCYASPKRIPALQQRHLDCSLLQMAK